MQLLVSGNLHLVDHCTEKSLRFQDMRERGPKYVQGCPDRMFGRHASLLSMQERKGKKNQVVRWAYLLPRITVRMGSDHLH